MKGTPSNESGNRLIARSTPDGAVADLRAFAWEVLRRREDYDGTGAAVTTEGPIEVTVADPAPRQWGLCFR